MGSHIVVTWLYASFHFLFLCDDLLNKLIESVLRPIRINIS